MNFYDVYQVSPFGKGKTPPVPFLLFPVDDNESPIRGGKLVGGAKTALVPLPQGFNPIVARDEMFMLTGRFKATDEQVKEALALGETSEKEAL